MSTSNTTTDHDVIREWAESRGGRPTRVKGTESNDGAGVLRFDFNEPEDKLEQISWDEFFETFDDRELALLYQDKTADGQTSRFFKLIHRRESDAEDSKQAEIRGRENDGGAKASGGSHAKGGHAEEPTGGADDLKSREYMDAQGSVHHHTRAYQESHKGEKK